MQALRPFWTKTASPLQRRAVADASVARVAAARGLITSGVERAAEIDEVVRAFAARGVRQDGQEVGLIWGQMAEPQGREGSS